MNKPHKHAKEIKAWADGAQIEYFEAGANNWFYVETPSWDLFTHYRIKPQPVIKKMYMHYGNIEYRAKYDKYDGVDVPQAMYASNKDMLKHLEFTFTDDKLTSVEIKGATK